MKYILAGVLVLFLYACKKTSDEDIFGPYWDVKYEVVSSDPSTVFIGCYSDESGAIRDLGDTASGTFVNTPWSYHAHYTQNPYAANTYTLYVEIFSKTGPGLLTANVYVDGIRVRQAVYTAPFYIRYELK